MFREVFQLTNREKRALFDICLLIVFVYIESWFKAPLAIKAPNLDLNVIKKLFEYKKIDPELAIACLLKVQNHGWYLTAEASALAFFDNEVSIEIKKKMVATLSLNVDTSSSSKKKFFFKDLSDMELLTEKNIDYFISSQTLKFFERFEIDNEFLQADVKTWPKNEFYLKASRIAADLHVVNDVSERAIQIVQNHINRTSNEDQKKYLCQVVIDYNKQFPNAKKETVSKKIKT